MGLQERDEEIINSSPPSPPANDEKSNGGGSASSIVVEKASGRTATSTPSSSPTRKEKGDKSSSSPGINSTIITAIMSISEEGGPSPGGCTDSFWHIGQYKRTVKRVDDGLKLCHDLMSLMKERGEIETAYAKSLQSWSKKWSDHIEKSPAYGTTKAAWRGVLDEADGLSELHLRIRDRLHDEPYATVKQWSKDNYHKNAFGAIKESKEAEDAFKKAQKPWAKLYTKVDKARKDYFHACRQEKTAINQDKNAQGDSSVSPDQQKKLSEKADKCREEREKCQDEYRKACDELNDNNAKYMEDMKQVFERCQDLEGKRLKFFKEMLCSIHQCLDISSSSQLKSIYATLANVIGSASSEQDLKWWSQNHGVGMTMNWPTFEEYTPELKPITKKEMRGGEGGIVLLGQKNVISAPLNTSSSTTNNNNGSNSARYSPPDQQQNTTTATTNTANTIRDGSNSTNASASNNEIGDSTVRTRTTGARQHPHQAPLSSVGGDANPYEDDWDALVDNGQPGQQVRALYDYAGQESDELTLKKDDIFEKLEDEDDQGWCKGRKDGRIGLYPANYAEPVVNS